ncbi:hypothetical protein [Rhodococcus sp. NPDC049939]|uniref:hypothetical protein n=1 Tax=Rhodococcus sp. NPDC049939 TaxID=3155511 RepID=UPI0033D5736B
MTQPLRIASIGVGRIAQVARRPAIDKTVDVPSELSEDIELFGSSGAVRVDIPFPVHKKPSDVIAYHQGRYTSPATDSGDAYDRQLEGSAGTIRENLEPGSNAVDGLAAVKAIEATHSSVAAGTAVAL